MVLADVAEPRSAAELAAALGTAAAEGRPVVPWGGGRHQHLGNPAPGEALRLTTTRLARVVEHSPADLTLTVEGGALLDALAPQLAAHGQWLPWDPPGRDGATVGGLLAAGVSGPLRLGYGTPRDWVLGMQVALADGRLVRSGGRVVKNVAGYETHKLHLGALGTLGVIVEATFRLAPLPATWATVVARCEAARAALVADLLRARPLSPSSLVICCGAWEPGEGSAIVAARFAGTPAGVARQVAEACGRARDAGAGAEPLDAGDADALWRQIVAVAEPRDGDESLIVRAGARPAGLGALLAAIERHTPQRAAIVGYAGVGLAYARWPAPDEPATGAALAALRRAAASLEGYLVVEHTPPALRGRIDVWGPAPEALPLMQALRTRWDPGAILNRGRYLV